MRRQGCRRPVRWAPGFLATIRDAVQQVPAAVTASASGDDLDESPSLADDRSTCYHRGVAQRPTSGAIDGGKPTDPAMVGELNSAGCDAMTGVRAGLT